jgi:hypothetical protein
MMNFNPVQISFRPPDAGEQTDGWQRQEKE